ncbi:serine hydrolase [Kibdelosporangium aridum]|uniref:Serine hydrolase n=1 Tax=Kibdelosporangium aridum TaxID=2030 RepID=A0A428ZKP6_KIBAR|nr:serine hydrolase domain-containing protein [Kibdelosporangium aridum]RSM88541.1 serine hydrolase [Kibdelosporangium aridum]
MKRALVGAVMAAAMVVPASVAVATPGKNPVQPIVDAGQAPGALAAIRRDGNERWYAAGKAVPVNGRVRIGSNTKAFVSVVVLQLVAEGKVELDGPAQRYVPAIKDKRITVRQLLQHTSGLPEYTDKLGLERIQEVRDRYFRPHDLLDTAMAHPAQFEPGTKFKYTNTNYVVAGLLVQSVTGRPVEEQITDRVIKRLGLRDTYWPAEGEQGLRGKHPRGYSLTDETDPKSPVIDITEMDPSWGWAAGQLVASPADLVAFYRQLPALLPPAQLAEMRKTVTTDEPDVRYGLGLVSQDLSCGGVYWGHSGGIHGYATLAGATDNGRAAAVAQTALPGLTGDPQGEIKLVKGVIDKALC